MQQNEIVVRLYVKRSTVNSLIQAARARSSTRYLADLQAAITVQPRSSRSRRAAGDEVPLTVRRGVQEHPYHAVDDAANRYLSERQVLGETDRNVQPLGIKQIYNIMQDDEKCSADPDEKRALTRNRAYRRNELLQIAQTVRHIYSRLNS